MRATQPLMSDGGTQHSCLCAQRSFTPLSRESVCVRITSGSGLQTRCAHRPQACVPASSRLKDFKACFCGTQKPARETRALLNLAERRDVPKSEFGNEKPNPLPGAMTSIPTRRKTDIRISSFLRHSSFVLRHSSKKDLPESPPGWSV
jgi:hypothetical protein